MSDLQLLVNEEPAEATLEEAIEGMKLAQFKSLVAVARCQGLMAGNDCPHLEVSPAFAQRAVQMLGDEPFCGSLGLRSMTVQGDLGAASFVLREDLR